MSQKSEEPADERSALVNVTKPGRRGGGLRYGQGGGAGKTGTMKGGEGFRRALCSKRGSGETQ